MAGRVLDQHALNGVSDQSSQVWQYLSIFAITLTVFIIEILTPRAFSAGVFLYYFPIYLASRLRFHLAPFIVGAIVSAAAMVGFFIATEHHSSAELFNRLFAVATLWAMAILAYRRIQKNRSLMEKKTAEESSKRLRDIITDSRFGIQIIDPSGRRLFVNQSFADMMGYKSTEAIMALPRFAMTAPHDLDYVISCRQIFNTPGSPDIPVMEFDALKNDGSTLRVQDVLQPIEWEGAPAFQRTIIDISDRKHAQDELAASERQYRDLIESNPLGILIVDGQGNRMLINQALAVMLGYESVDDVKNLPNRFHLPADHLASPLSLEEMESLDANYSSSREVELVKKDGSILSVQVFRRILIWEGKEAVQRTYIDLSEKKRAQAALVESEKDYRDLIERAVLGIQIADGDGNRLLVNNALSDLLGYDSNDDVVALPRFEFIAPHHQDRALPFAEMASSGEQYSQPREIDLLRKDGAIVPVQVFWRNVRWEGKFATQLTFVDLSERKRAQEALVRSERHFRDLTEQSTMGMQINNRQHKRLFVNEALVAMLGYDSAEEVLAIDGYGLVAPEYLHLTKPAGRIDAKEETFEPYELGLLRKDGTTLPVQVFWRVIVWEGQDAIHRSYIDISERKRAEKDLVDSEQRYRELYERSPLGIRISDALGNRATNLTLANMLGYDSVDELQNLTRLSLIAPHDFHRAITFEMIEAGEKEPTGSMEMDLLRKDGTMLPVQVFWRTFEWQGVKAVERTYIDISERKEHERILRQSDRTVQELRHALAYASQIGAMGEVASVIAHELHQPLAAIVNTANAAQRRLADRDIDKTTVLNEMLPLIASQASRAGQVIGGIRNLFDGKPMERSRADINTVVAEACELAVNEFTANSLNIIQHYPDKSPTALIDRVQIQQVIYNLLRNAVDALRGSTNKDVIVSVHIIDDGSIEISVHDDGPGLSSDIRSKLFEPFFTTKEKGKGMGMGLYTCQRIVEGHEGKIWVEPDERGGTTAGFTLPLTGN